MATQILIVEDDRQLARLLQIDLQRHGFDVIVSDDGIEGLRLFQDCKPDLVVLDVALPGMDGLTICERIRAVSKVPILMMTGHAITERDIANGLDRGADEYMIKPLGKIEFYARVKALLRRAHLQTDKADSVDHFDDGYLSVDLRTRNVSVDGSGIRLTPTEFKLLSTFIQHPDTVMSFQSLLEQVWGVEYRHEHHYPRIYVSHLRRKIEPDVKQPTYIHSEYGVGYRFSAGHTTAD